MNGTASRAARATLVALIASTALMTSASPASAVACASGTPSGDLCYTETGGNATIVDYTGAGGSVTIPATLGGFPVTAVGNNVFQYVGLTAVTLPSSLVTIGSSAFAMNSLTSVVVPDAVTTIGSFAFDDNDIDTLTLGNSVAVIGTGAFLANELTTLTIPASVNDPSMDVFSMNPLATVTMEGNEPTMLQSWLFGDVTATSDPLVTFHAGATYTTVTPGYWRAGTTDYRVQEVSTVSFSSAYAEAPSPVDLVTLNALDGITSGQLADPGVLTEPGYDFLGWFAAPTGGAALTFPLGITADTTLYAQFAARTCAIGTPSGDFCYTETDGNATIVYYTGTGGNVTIPGTIDGYPVTAVGGGAFFISFLTAVSFPDSLLTIGDQAFRFNNLASVTVPDSVTSIGDSAFDSNGISTLTLGGSLATIGPLAFNANSLTEVTIPASVTEIGDWAFEDNPLAAVKMGGDEPASIGIDILGDVHAGADPLVTFHAGANYSRGFLGRWAAGGGHYRVQEEATVTFHSTHGTAPSATTVIVLNALEDVSLGMVADPGALTADGYRFTGWYYSTSGGTLVEFPWAVTSDASLYAHWAAPAVTAPATADAGNAITVDGTGFEPGESVRIELHSDPVLLTTVVADAGGAVRATVTLPASTPAGAHTLVLVGSASGVTSRPIVLSGELSLTGVSPAPGVLTALVLVGVGLLLRRRAA